MAATDPPAQRSRVIACILNWNNIDDTLECLESVLESDYPSLSVWVVDNGSDDDPTEVIERRYPSVRVLRLPRNYGYGGGNNVALERALAEGAEFILLLNNDVIVARDMVSQLADALEANPDVGMATPRVFFHDRPTAVHWDGGTIDWSAGEVFHDSSTLPTRDGLILSEWLDGASLFVRGSLVRQVGLFDDRYFLYYEDTEWSTRARRAGWLIAVVPKAACWHKVSRSSGGAASPCIMFYMIRNRYLFFANPDLPPARRLTLIRYLRLAYRDYRRWTTSSYSRWQECAGYRRAIVEACLAVIRRRWGRRVRRDGDRLFSALDAVAFGLLSAVSWLKSVGRTCGIVIHRSSGET